MADLLRDGLAWLTTQLAANASQTVLYARGSSSVSVLATLGTQVLKLTDADGGERIEWTDLDLLIPFAGFTFDGTTPIVPTRGDTATVTQHGFARTYEVAPYGPDEPVWRWSDPHRSQLRVHFKLTDDGA